MLLPNPSRRQFLQATAAVTASLIVPRKLVAENSDLRFYFLRVDSCISWPVADPVKWALENRHEAILERASEGLAKLTENDGDRIIRLVVRRCHLNLLELRPEQVVVHHWGPHRADLRPFFKQHRLARSHVEVVLNDRKKEVVTTQTGDDFLFGDSLAPDFPLDLFLGKWASRFDRQADDRQADDRQAAPGTWSGYAWEGVEDGRIPWAAMKSAWRRAAPLICLNCDTPTLLVNFGQPWSSMFSRTPRFVHVCGTCRRSFANDSVTDVAGWLATNLDAEVRPGFDMVWDHRIHREERS